MKILVIFGLFATVLLVSQAGAENYRYVDQHGNMIYTDDMNQIPQDYRSKAEVITSTDFLSPFGTDTDGTKPKNPALPDPPGKDLENERRRLAATKARLEAEFRALVKENTGLKEEQKAAVTPEQVRAINKKAVDFNTRFRAYQEKKAAYEAQIKSFNKKHTIQN